MLLFNFQLSQRCSKVSTAVNSLKVSYQFSALSSIIFIIIIVTNFSQPSTLILTTIIIKVRQVTIKANNLNNLKARLINLENNLGNLKTWIVIRKTRNCPTK